MKGKGVKKVARGVFFHCPLQWKVSKAAKDFSHSFCFFSCASFCSTKWLALDIKAHRGTIGAWLLTPAPPFVKLATLGSGLLVFLEWGA